MEAQVALTKDMVVVRCCYGGEGSESGGRAGVVPSVPGR